MTDPARRIGSLGFASALVLSLSNVVIAQVPVEREPRHHLVFENSALRVLDINIEPGDTTLDHTHSHDMATVCLSGTQMRNRVPGAEWGAPGTPCELGRATATEYVRPVTHRAQNVGNTLFRLIGVENLRQTGWPEDAPFSGAAANIVKETRAFRLYEVHLAADGVDVVHVHKRPVVVVLVRGELVPGRDQPERSVPLDQAHRWSFVAAGESHRLAGGRTGETLLVEIEIR